MEFSDIRKIIKNKGYLGDDDSLACFASTTFYEASILNLAGIPKITNQLDLPSYILVSIKNDLLYISKASATGKFISYYANIPINTMNLVKVEPKMSQNSYEFKIINPTGEYTFYLVPIMGDHEYYADKIVKYIVNYNRRGE